KISKQKLPHKIWVDCINCPKFPRCDEIPMMKIIKK
ncbi:MAG: GNAT family N-acetyltransferase, partial [bacterium]|nr:GNAT family N-acetyltransferase [bacterium]